MLVTPPIEPIEIETLKLLGITLSPIILRGLGIAIHIVSSVIFGYLLSDLLGKSKIARYIGFFIFFASPWTSYLSVFYIVQNVLILVFLIIIRTKKPILAVLILIPAIFYLNNFYKKDYSILNKISFANIKIETNEAQRVNYLSVERRFILPYVARLFMYNEAGIAAEKTLSHFVSFFDFEHLISPEKTYELIKLSGVPPKGNLQLLYIWGLPLVIYGLFVTIKERKNINLLLILGFVSIVPFLLFEKKLLPQTAFLSIVPILVLKGVGIYSLFKKFGNKVIIIGALFTIIASISFYNTLFLNPSSYQSPSPRLYREISQWLIKNYNSSNNYIITTRFGSTETLVPFYLGKNYSNIKFQNFDINKDILEDDTYYVGLIGEFVGKGKDLESKSTPGGIKIVDKITGDEEPVFEYGGSIWIGYYKN